MEREPVCLDEDEDADEEDEDEEDEEEDDDDAAETVSSARSATRFGTTDLPRATHTRQCESRSSSKSKVEPQCGHANSQS